MKNKTPQCHVKYSLYELMCVLSESSTDEQNSIAKRDALDLVEKRLRQKNLLHDIDFTKNKSGHIRWENNLQFYFIDLSKSEFAHRKRGQWWILDKGKEFIQSATADTLYEYGRKAYIAWQERTSGHTQAHVAGTSTVDMDAAATDKKAEYSAAATLEDAQENARRGIEEQLKKMNPYQFQDLVAAVIESTGWTIQNIAKRGPDGGIDIEATLDTLGTQQPRLCVQVKHYINSGQNVRAQEVSELRGSLPDSNTSAGMLVCSTDFTKAATAISEKNTPHIDLRNLNDLLDMIEARYEKISAKGKKLLNLKPVYFIAPDEE